nr:3-dehydroquinate synthase [Algoriphagus sp.]
SGENLIKGLREFQEHLGGQLTIMLLERLGKGVEVHEMDHAMIEEAVKMLKDWNQEAISKS